MSLNRVRLRKLPSLLIRYACVCGSIFVLESLSLIYLCLCVLTRCCFTCFWIWAVCEQLCAWVISTAIDINVTCDALITHVFAETLNQLTSSFQTTLFGTESSCWPSYSTHFFSLPSSMRVLCLETATGFPSSSSVVSSVSSSSTDGLTIERLSSASSVVSPLKEKEKPTEKDRENEHNRKISELRLEQVCHSLARLADCEETPNQSFLA